MDYYDVAKPIVDRTARSLANDWPGIDREGIAQEIWVKLAENEKGIERCWHTERPALIAGLAKRGGVAYCSRERQFYQHYTAEWIYTPREIRALLAQFFDEDSWLEPVKRPEDTNQTLMGDGIVIALMDMRSAFEALTEQDQAVIMTAYATGEPLDANGRKTLQRAVDRMTNYLNRQVSQRFDHSDHDGPGARDSVSNATGRAMTADAYYN